MPALVSSIAAIGRDAQDRHVLGKDNELLWRIPEDLKRFKALTLGHPVIMGRKTFDSIKKGLGGPLPERTNIVITRDHAWQHEGVEVAHSLEDALAVAKNIDPSEIFIIGGAQIYAAALPYTDRLYLTIIDDEKDGDAFFPEYENSFAREISRESKISSDNRSYTWLTLARA